MEFEIASLRSTNVALLKKNTSLDKDCDELIGKENELDEVIRLKDRDLTTLSKKLETSNSELEKSKSAAKKAHDGAKHAEISLGRLRKVQEKVETENAALQAENSRLRLALEEKDKIVLAKEEKPNFKPKKGKRKGHEPPVRPKSPSRRDTLTKNRLPLLAALQG